MNVMGSNKLAYGNLERHTDDMTRYKLKIVFKCFWN